MIDQYQIDDLRNEIFNNIDANVFNEFINVVMTVENKYDGIIELKTRNAKGNILSYGGQKYFSIILIQYPKPVICAGAIVANDIFVPAIRFSNTNNVLKKIDAKYLFPYTKGNWTYVTLNDTTTAHLEQLIENQILQHKGYRKQHLDNTMGETGNGLLSKIVFILLVAVVLFAAKDFIFQNKSPFSSLETIRDTSPEKIVEESKNAVKWVPSDEKEKSLENAVDRFWNNVKQENKIGLLKFYSNQAIKAHYNGSIQSMKPLLNFSYSQIVEESKYLTDPDQIRSARFALLYLDRKYSQLQNEFRTMIADEILNRFNGYEIIDHKILSIEKNDDLYIVIQKYFVKGENSQSNIELPITQKYYYRENKWVFK